jgi:hypothetical protein
VDELGLALLADKHQTLVLDDPKQPCSEFGFSLELIDVLECFPACILCFFFRLSAVSEDGGGQIHTSATMAANQLAKRVSIAMFRHSNEVLVRQNSVK